MEIWHIHGKSLRMPQLPNTIRFRTVQGATTKMDIVTAIAKGARVALCGNILIEVRTAQTAPIAGIHNAQKPPNSPQAIAKGNGHALLFKLTIPSQSKLTTNISNAVSLVDLNS